MMTNASAQTIAWAAKYDPFGVPVAVTVSPVNNQRLPGQWFQIEDGLAYNWHRTYDPSLGRYSQADPLGFVDGPSVYTYVNNNPVIGVDTDGRSKVIGPMTPIPQSPNPIAPKQCGWDDRRKECHENCRDFAGRPDAFFKYWQCVNACMAK